MKKLSTILSLFGLAFFAFSFSSCSFGEISTKIAIRFENVSDQDMQLVTIDNIVIDEIKAGETTEYFDFKDVEINYSNLPNLDIQSSIFSQFYDYHYQDYRQMIFCGMDCGVEDYYSDDEKNAMLAKGNYTIQLNANIRAEAASDNKQLVVSLLQD